MRDADREASVPEEESSKTVGGTWRPGSGRKVGTPRGDDRNDGEQQFQQTPRPAPLAADRHEWGP
jgi:hypothetical protein